MLLLPSMKKVITKTENSVIFQQCQGLLIQRNRLIGCMYKHAAADKCSSSACRNILCQFEHEQEVETIDDDPIENEKGTDNDSEDKKSLNGNNCHLCLEQMNSKDELYDQMERDHEDFFYGIMEAARSMSNLH